MLEYITNWIDQTSEWLLSILEVSAPTESVAVLPEPISQISMVQQNTNTPEIFSDALFIEDTDPAKADEPGSSSSAPPSPSSVIDLVDDDVDSSLVNTKSTDFQYLRHRSGQGVLLWSDGTPKMSVLEKTALATQLSDVFNELGMFRNNHAILKAEVGLDIVSRTNTNGWANDETINYYMSSLIKRSSHVGHRIGWANTLWFKEGTYINRADFSSDRNIQGNLLRQANLILIPFNYSNHWYLVAIYKKSDTEFTIYGVDSLNYTADHANLFSTSKAFLSKLYPNVDLSITTQSLKIPKQNNLIDCGYVLCAVANLLATASQGLNKLISFGNFFDKSCNYSSARVHVMQSLLEYATDEIAEMEKAKLPKKVITPRYEAQIILDSDSDSNSDSDNEIKIVSAVSNRRLKKQRLT